ncbi:MAG: TetR/AcrR family transcriptional regulator [Capsulimonas sp.]|uniref:TetR/AcrR family transcriptional regulator n=1 Tax=Capsulimonas sp. TaxID=2494211 RepID=UPI003266100B
MQQAEKKQRGRPASSSATSHEQILDAVQAILTEKSVRDLTIEEVARRAGVGKPTIYKWWPSKFALVLDLFERQKIPTVRAPMEATAEEVIRLQVATTIEFLNGFFGKVARELVAEAQSSPDLLREYQERYIMPRRAVSHEVIYKAITSGEFRRDTDPDILIDMIYGPIYYRLLIRYKELDTAYGDTIVTHALSTVKKEKHS